MALWPGRKQKPEEGLSPGGEPKEESGSPFNLAMLPKENRLKKEKDFEAVFREGKGSACGPLRVKSICNKSEVARFGFIVSKKYSKKASERNLIKRRMREIIRKMMPEIKNGYDIVLLASPGLENDYQKLQERIKTVLKNLNLKNQPNGKSI